MTTADNKMVLTSSRDERMSRRTFAPSLVEFEDIKFISPIDGEQKGTWIGASEQGRVICLLNGASSGTSPKSEFERSRGTVVTAAFEYPSVDAFILDQNLSEVAPFTMLLAEPHPEAFITELQWNGTGRSVKHFPIEIPKLWSSTTLYNESQREEKEGIFRQWISDQVEITPEKVFNFHLENFDIRHQSTGRDLAENLGTVSITQIVVHLTSMKMSYFDLKTSTHHKMAIPLIKNAAAHV